MTDADVIDSMLDRLSGKRAAPTVRDALRQFIEAVDADAVRMDSNDLNPAQNQLNDPAPPYPWHEEWLHHARAALAAAEKDESELVKAISLVEVDLTAGDMPTKTRVALALHRVRAVLAKHAKE